MVTARRLSTCGRECGRARWASSRQTLRATLRAERSTAGLGARPACDGGYLAEEAFHGVEFAGPEEAHRMDHAGQERAEEIPPEGDGLLADPDLHLAAVGGARLPVDVSRGLQPVDEGGGGGRGEPELGAEPADRDGDADTVRVEQADQGSRVGVVQGVRPGKRGPCEVKLHGDRPELMYQLQAPLVLRTEVQMQRWLSLDSLLSRSSR